MARLSVVDPHFHVWDLATGNYPHFEKPSTGFVGSNEPIARSYLIEEYLAEGGAEVEIVKAVHVEAIPVDPIGETRYMQAVADRIPIPLGLVVNADLSAADAAFGAERNLEIERILLAQRVAQGHEEEVEIEELDEARDGAEVVHPCPDGADEPGVLQLLQGAEAARRQLRQMGCDLRLVAVVGEVQIVDDEDVDAVHAEALQAVLVGAHYAGIGVVVIVL